MNTSQLLVQKVPPKYPEASRRAGTEGTVVLEVGVDTSGAVQDVTVVSGDSALANAAADAVRQWKYKPYPLESAPIEIETQVTVNFHLASPAKPAPPPLGAFRDDTYSNEYFNLFYPLSRDWVRETELVRKRVSAENHSQGTHVLLTEVHIPQDNTDLRADSSFTLLAVSRSSGGATENCKLYLDALASSVHVNKEGKQKGEVSEFSLAGHDFLRADFEYRRDVSHHSTICAVEKDYLLLWNIEGLSRKADEQAVSTLNSLLRAPPPGKPDPPLDRGTPKTPTQVRVAQGVSTGLLLKKVTPIYPEEARRNRIQGTVRMNAVISKTGDVVDLEVVDGPIELAVSAVNAVRLWKYRPYTLNYEPVTVLTQIQVNYMLSP